MAFHGAYIDLTDTLSHLNQHCNLKSYEFETELSPFRVRFYNFI